MISAQQWKSGPLQPACKKKNRGEGLGRLTQRPHGLLSARITEARPASARELTQNAAKAWAANLNSRLGRFQPKAM
jgi:hypothetical protein